MTGVRIIRDKADCLADLTKHIARKLRAAGTDQVGSDIFQVLACLGG